MLRNRFSELSPAEVRLNDRPGRNPGCIMNVIAVPQGRLKVARIASRPIFSRPWGLVVLSTSNPGLSVLRLSSSRHLRDVSLTNEAYHAVPIVERFFPRMSNEENRVVTLGPFEFLTHPLHALSRLLCMHFPLALRFSVFAVIAGFSLAAMTGQTRNPAAQRRVSSPAEHPARDAGLLPPIAGLRSEPGQSRNWCRSSIN